jgi:hypothetical protein
MRSPFRRTTVALLGAGCMVASLSFGATAQPVDLGGTVSDNPADVTPQVAIDADDPHPVVYALKQLGATMYAGGSFHTITSAGQSLPRVDLFAFDAASGTVSASFLPVVNGDVWAIKGNGSSLFIGGTFTTVDGVPRDGIAKIDATTGALDPTFASAVVDGPVTEIRLINGRLIVSGRFSQRLLALDPVTGADTGYINVPIGGQIAGNSGPARVYRFAVNPAGTRLVGIGNFTSVGGLHRERAFMLNLGTTSATVSSWWYPPLDHICRAARIPEQLRDVDFSTDGTFFVFFASGNIPVAGGVGHDVCDAAARFETPILHPTAPTWINYTGGDTMWSGAISGNVVYAQGHFRWLDNPQGNGTCLTTCVPREGIGAIDATTGAALPWNPGKTRAVGGKDLLVTNDGLWVASDGARLGREHHYGIAFLPGL